MFLYGSQGVNVYYFYQLNIIHICLLTGLRSFCQSGPPGQSKLRIPSLTRPLLSELPGTTHTAVEYSLVDSGVVLPLPGEAKHATDDSAAEPRPLRVTDLLPFTAVFDLHVALRYGDSPTVR